LLFYYPNRVTKTGEVVFDTRLVKVGISVSNGEKVFREAVSVLFGKKPRKSCEWCGMGGY